MTGRIPVENSYTNSGKVVIYFSRESRNADFRHKYSNMAILIQILDTKLMQNNIFSVTLDRKATTLYTRVFHAIG